MIAAVGVVVPVHNEEEHLGACLLGILVALRSVPAPVATFVVIVLDACSDGSASIAESATDIAGAEVLCLNAQNVGIARNAGMARVLAHFASHRPQTVWLATTDADSVVPPDWLSDQVVLANEGADAIAGTVRVGNWQRFPRDRAAAFEAFYMSGAGNDEHDHVHGANLGIRADAYLEVGGFQARASGEDHALWTAVRGVGRRTVATRRIPVATSSRLSGRAPGGFASFLCTFVANSP